MPENYTQANRPIGLTTPLGEDVLLLTSLRLVERLNHPFELTLLACSEQKSLTTKSLLGESVTVRINLPDNKKRYINGIVRSFYQTGYAHALAEYEIVVVPWLWLLELSSDCKIYQRETNVEVIQQVFRDFGFASYTNRLNAIYPSLGVVTQYGETHANFVHRLMEKEGIGYCFEHTVDSHRLVLFDANTSLEPLPGFQEIPFRTHDTTYEMWDTIHHWKCGASLGTGKFTLGEYDYIAPKQDLSASASTGQGVKHSDLERYEYPGGYDADIGGDHYAKIAAEAELAARSIIHGEAVCAGISAGHVFKMTHMPRSDQNAEFVITAVDLQIEVSDYWSHHGPEDTMKCRTKFECLPKDLPYRPQRITPKPRIHGVHSATVTGPDGQDPKIPYVSPLGSVKVKFHWERSAPSSSQSSGWVRVSQFSAGPSYGSVFNPRIGNEVLVAFEDGDPDRPVVVGRVYNANQTPALPLPKFAQRSYFCDDAGNAVALTPENHFESIVLYSPYKETIRVIGATPDGEIDPNIKIT